VPPNLNIISWNYDLQLELALHEFMHSTTLSQTMKDSSVLPRGGEYRLMRMRYDEGKIIHLNGLACLISNLNGMGEHVVNLFDLFRDSEISDLQSFLNIFQSLKDMHGFENSYFMSFAWEDEKIVNEYITRANKILFEAQDLVVIGYSFPNFNRSIDNSLIDAFLANGAEDKRVFIQDPTPGRDKVFQMLYPNCKHVLQETSVDEFFIPPGV
jgi:hypothetical protein